MSQDVLGANIKEGSVEALTELQAATIGTASTLHLYKSSFSPNQTNVEADFIAAEATFSGYTPAALTFASVGLDAAGNAVSYASRVEFQNSTGVIGDTIGGAWVSVAVAGPANKAVRYFPFPAPINMSQALQTLGAIVVSNMPHLLGKIIIDN